MNAGLAVGDRDELVLEQLRDTFSDFDIGFAGGMYLARLLAGGPLLTAPTLGGLASALLARTEPPARNRARRQAVTGPRDELKRLREHWWPRYDIEFTGNAYIARRLGVVPLRPAGTLEEADSRIRTDYARWFLNVDLRATRRTPFLPAMKDGASW